MATNVKTVKPLAPARTSPKLVVADVAFDANGDANVTAAELGLNVINGFAGGAWGGTDEAVATIYSKTTFASAGVTSVDLLAYEADGGTDAALNVTCAVLFWGSTE